MFNTTNIITDIFKIPSNWIFEKYADLKVKLTGQDIKIKSIFNINERTASLAIYVYNGRYIYHDFSSGKSGSAIDFVKNKYNITYEQSCLLIKEDYNNYIKTNQPVQNAPLIAQKKYEVSSYKKRNWTVNDGKFWTQYNIGTTLLNKYNVYPLESYKLCKECNSFIDEFDIVSHYIYGYFKEDGTIYKIYQPKNQDFKFLTVSEYIQGSDQLKGKKYLIITSSLKDIMSLESLGIDSDFIAPASENTMINKNLMEKYINTYEKVIIFFDNDVPGKNSSEKYIKLYPQIISVILPLSKDVSDSIRDYGKDRVKTDVIVLLNKKLNA